MTSPAMWSKLTMRACLVDVYETVVSCDLRAHAVELPRFAGIHADAWNDAFQPLAVDIGSGVISRDDAMVRILGAVLVCRDGREVEIPRGTTVVRTLDGLLAGEGNRRK